MALPVGVALPLAIVCALTVEIICTWLLFWLYMVTRFSGFYLSRYDQYDLDHPSIFEEMREWERLFEDFAASLAGDQIRRELRLAYCWPYSLSRMTVCLIHTCRRKFGILLYFVKYSHVYQRYLRRLRCNRRKLAWPHRTFQLAKMALLKVAWRLLDWGDACYCRYQNVRYLWKRPQLRARYQERRRFRKLRSRALRHGR